MLAQLHAVRQRTMVTPVLASTVPLRRVESPRSGSTRVLVKQTAKAIRRSTWLPRATIGSLGRQGTRCSSPWCGRAFVGVMEELLQCPLQAPPSEDQQVVEALSASDPRPAFSEGVPCGRPVRRADDLYALAFEDLIEGGAEL